MQTLRSFVLALFVVTVCCSAQSIAPKATPLTHIVRKADLQTQSLAVGTHLNYYGGPVISNVQVVAVYWGNNVSQAVRSEMPDFYHGMTQSSFFDLLSEYSTNVPFGTHQSIGRGSFISGITINPSITSPLIQDAQIQAELVRQISNGYLPLPKEDLSGNVSTEYMIYFPPGIVEASQGLYSCSDFCGYHGVALFNGKFVPYGVIPDLSAGGGCDRCGGGTEIQNVMAVSSHELVESVTDTEVTLATGPAAPLAWYDPTFPSDSGVGSGAEIGDICNAQHAVVATPVGYVTVQRVFSNAADACVYSGLHPLYQLSAPSSTNTGSPLNLVLTVNNPIAGQGTHTSFVGTVHFTSSDAAATLPTDYTFTPADEGVHSFSLNLGSNGSQTITATDTINGAITARTTVTGISHFSVLAVPSALSVTVGTRGSASMQTTITAGINQPLTFSLNGLPARASASFGAPPFDSGQGTILFLNMGTAAPGVYPLLITATSPTEQHTTPLTLTIVDQPRSGSLATSDAADLLSWTYQTNAVNAGSVEFRICKAPSITWWKELVVRSGNFVLGDVGVKDASACSSFQLAPGSLSGNFQMELWKAKFLGISTQVKVMPSDYFGDLAPGSRITMTWLKD